MEKRKLVIIGSGPAGYTAAIYAARANLEPLIFEGFYSGPAGGQLMTTTEVENYPGFPEAVTGPELMDRFRDQAKRFGTIFVTEDVKSVQLTSHPFIIKSPSHEVEAEAIIIATGATAKRLDVPGTRDGEFWQKGVTACAVCDGAFFRDQELALVGGGDSALREAIFLTKFEEPEEPRTGSCRFHNNSNLNLRLGQRRIFGRCYLNTQAWLRIHNRR